MSSPSLPHSSLPPDWTAVVDRIQAALAETLAAAAARQRDLKAMPPIPDVGDFAETDAPRLLDERLQAFADRVQQAERTAAEAEASLEAGCQSIQTWLVAAETFRQKLAVWDGQRL